MHIIRNNFGVQNLQIRNDPVEKTKTLKFTFKFNIVSYTSFGRSL